MKLWIAAAAAAALTPAAAFAQDTTAPATADPMATAPQDPMAATPADPATAAPAQTTAADASTAEAPDGSPAFGFEPYVALMGGYHDFDSDRDGPLTTNCNPSSGCPDGGLIEGIVGANIPLGPVFVGAEGNIAKGFRGIKVEYGVHGRAGARIGDSGLIYGKAGYQWIETKDKGDNDNWSYGLGVEVGPKDIGLGGLTGNSGLRLRLEVSTYDLKSIRPTAGVVFHF